MKFIDIAAILLLSVVIGCSRNSEGVTNNSSMAPVKTFVQDFYSWYVPKVLNNDVSPAWVDAIKQKENLFDKSLLLALKTDAVAQSESPEEIVGLDFDPFLASQDPCEQYVIGNITNINGRYFVEIYGVCSGKRNVKPDVIAELGQVNNALEFVNFHYQQGRDLMSVLESLKQGRVGNRDGVHPLS